MGYDETSRNHPPSPEYSPQQGDAQQELPPQGVGYPPEQGYTAQPQMQPIPGGNEKRNLQTAVVQPQSFKSGSFQNHFFSCFDVWGTCCLGTWCPCILYGKTRARFQTPSLPREQLPSCSGACCGYATVLLFCAPFQCIFGWIQRGDIRAKYGIEGNGCMDCLAHTFCDCCVCS